MLVRQVGEKYTIGTLERVARHGERLARRGAVLVLGRLADYRSNSVLGKALTDSDRGVRTLAEAAVELVWHRVGTAAEQRRLAAVADQLEERDFDRAARLAGKLIQQSPWIAQAWYQRGTAHFHLGQFEAATRLQSWAILT